MSITAIDPGTEQSALVIVRDGKIDECQIYDNDQLLEKLRIDQFIARPVAVEMIACYGMPVGRETFETCLLIGRIQEVLYRRQIECRLVYRREVKIHLCGSMKAKDANIAQALKDKWGSVGTAKNPGPLFGIKSHLWSALAVADYAINNP